MAVWRRSAANFIEDAGPGVSRAAVTVTAPLVIVFGRVLGSGYGTVLLKHNTRCINGSIPCTLRFVRLPDLAAGIVTDIVVP